MKQVKVKNIELTLVCNCNNKSAKVNVNIGEFSVQCESCGEIYKLDCNVKSELREYNE